MKKKKKNSKQFNRQFKKRFFTKKSVIIIVCTIVILAAFGLGYQKIEKKAAKYQKTINELNTEIKNIKQTNKTLEEEKNNLDTDEFKERIARERLGMIKEGEISLQEAKDGEEIDNSGVTSGSSDQENTASTEESGGTTDSKASTDSTEKTDNTANSTDSTGSTKQAKSAADATDSVEKTGNTTEKKKTTN